MFGILIDPEDLQRIIGQFEKAGMPPEQLARLREMFEAVKGLNIPTHGECPVCSAEFKRLTDKLRTMDPLTFEGRISREAYGTAFRGTGDLEVQAVFLTMIVSLGFLTLEKHYRNEGRTIESAHTFECIRKLGSQMAMQLFEKGK